MYLSIIDYSIDLSNDVNIHLILQNCPKLTELKINFNIFRTEETIESSKLTITYPLMEALSLSMHFIDDFHTNFKVILFYFPNLQTLKLSQKCTNTSLQMSCNCSYYSMRDDCYLNQTFADIYKYGSNVISLELQEIPLTNEIVQTMIDMSSQLKVLKIYPIYCESVNKELKQKFYERYYKLKQSKSEEDSDSDFRDDEDDDSNEDNDDNDTNEESDLD